MRKCISGVLLVTGLATFPALAWAQRRPAARPAAAPAQRPRFAAELNWSSDVNFGIGARGVFPLESAFPGTPLDGIVSFDIFFPSAPPGTGSSASYWEINGDLAYRFHMERSSSLGPYAGGGLNIAHASATVTAPPPGTGTISSSATKAGLNLLAGTTFKLTGSNLTPFAEARGEIGGGKTFILTGGIRF
jgi:opacity protein-like surface antigen